MSKCLEIIHRAYFPTEQAILLYKLVMLISRLGAVNL